LLDELILQRRGVSSSPELVRSIYGTDAPRLEIASLADLVEQAAGQGDRVAIAILDEAAQELARTVAAIYPKLGAASPPLVLTGGTILHGVYLQAAFRRACESLGLVFAEEYFVSEPAQGAVQLALKTLFA
jgi:N-acetylglucosamine kinase-like BadF-type ATPase